MWIRVIFNLDKLSLLVEYNIAVSLKQVESFPLLPFFILLFILSFSFYIFNC